MPQPLTDTASAVLDDVRAQYEQLRGRTQFSLQDLFCPDHFRLDAWCRSFHPHPQSGELAEVAKSFGSQYGLWLENARHHITCALFLYPDAEPLRMLDMMKNLLIDFYLNDVMGRDVFPLLPEAKQREAERIIARIGKYDPELPVPENALPVEFANILVLRDFRDNAPDAWFQRFHRLFTQHVAITHRDNSAVARGGIPTVEEYIEQRCHYAGMHHIVMWVEYANGDFLDWNWLSDAGMEEDLRQLHHTVTAFGALSNDLFSFEKEVIVHGSDANLMMAVLLNGKAYTLQNVIRQSAAIVRNLLEDYFRLTDDCKRRMQVYTPLFPQQTALVLRHLAGLERCMQACWAWQVHTKRYKSPGSIWLETMLPVPEKIR